MTGDTAGSPAPRDGMPVPVARRALERMCEAAVRAAGGSAFAADVLATAVVAAEGRGKPEVGVAHLFDYLDALRCGRLNGRAEPWLSTRRPAALLVDADAGTTQVAFESFSAALVEVARSHGLAMLSVRNAFTAGELGYYTSRVAEHGLVALAGANSPALMAVYDAKEPLAGTNPFSFAVPHAEGPRLFDQASSATAWVKVRDAAARGEEIPEGWALTSEGIPTTDACAALTGPLLPFGGVKGSNIAMMVELLSVLGGARFSLDAAPFDSGADSPGTGLFLIAVDPAAFDPGYAGRAERHLVRLSEEFGVDFGRRKPRHEVIELPEALHRALAAAGEGAAGSGS